MNTGFGTTRLKSGFQLLPFILLLVVSSAFAQFAEYEDLVPRYPNQMDGPVNMVKGRFSFAATDLVVPGRGLSLEFTRYYHGTAVSPMYRSYLGQGWSHSYQWQLNYEGRPNSDDETEHYWHVITGSGAQQTFKEDSSRTTGDIPAVEATLNPEPGVRASLEFTATKVFIYTTKSGIKYQFEHYPATAMSKTYKNYVLTQISDPNGNTITLHYENAPDATATSSTSRLVAVEDALGRFLKFYYGLQIAKVSHPRHISKIEYGLGTAQALTTVYQTIKYTQTKTVHIWLASVRRQLEMNDPLGTELVTEYEYNSTHGLLAITTPLDHRTEIDSASINGKSRVMRVRVEDGGTDAVLYERQYGNGSDQFNGLAYTRDSQDKRRGGYHYTASGGHITTLKVQRWPDPSSSSGSTPPTRTPTDIGKFSWGYDDKTNITRAYYRDEANSAGKWAYKIEYAGTNAAHNEQMGNATKWEQVESNSPYSAVRRKWEADYQIDYNRPIWQIDAMGHRTEFKYDDNGNLTEVRSKANTGTQAHAIGHDIITTYKYDSYGNRVKTTFMPDTSQEKVVETVYDTTHNTYPVAVKTTVTVDGVARIIRTQSVWDVNRGLKTADIDAQGRRTEYVYWKDRRLKYTYDVAANLYTVPTYDADGRVTQIQVRQDNYQTGTRVAQTKTEYDAMGRAVKARSFNNNNWTAPYTTTESTYDIFGNMTQTKDPRALITTYTHDPHGFVTKQTLPDGDWTETRYNALWQPTKAWTSQTGSESSPAVSYSYDNLNRTSQVSYSTGESVAYTYDKGDNLLTQGTNDGSQSYKYTYTYDQLNRPITRDDSLLGYETLYEYDDASMRTRMHIQKSMGETDLYDVTYSYDEANRLLAVTDVLASKTADYEYFDIGALKTAIDPNGISAHRTLDSRHRLDLLTYKKTPTTVLSSLDYTYDVKSNVTKLVRNDTGAGGTSKTFTFGYDGISRLTSANYGNETVSYTYDKSGNRKTQVSSVDGTTTYTVATDSNQLTRRSLVPEDTDFATMNYSYDAEGRLTQRSEGTDSDAFTYSFGSQLTQIQKTRAGAVTQTLSYAYDGSGQRVKVTDSSGTRYFLYDGGMPVLELDQNKKITNSYLYGADGVVYRRKHNTVAHWHFDEGNGTIAHDVDGANHGTLGGGRAAKTPTWSFGCGLLFDGVNDLVKVPDSDSLDLAGDKITIAAWVQPHSAKVAPLVEKINKTHGYRISQIGTTLRFVLRRNGQDKTVTSTTTLPLHKWTHVAARYDGAQIRIFINGTIDTATTAATGSLSATTAPLFIGGGHNHFHGYLDDISIYDRALSDSEITDLVNCVDKRYEYHHINALGSNIVSTDDDQNVLARYEYDVFGAIRAETGTSDNTRKFTGKEFDADSNLYYYGARYYDPYIGRFTQRDPAEDGVNWYAYTYNNPLKYTDPTGQAAKIRDLSDSPVGFMHSVVWDPVEEHFAFNDGSGVTKLYSPEKLTSLLLDFTPIIGDAKGFVEGIIGKELLTGEPLSPVDRFLGLVLLSEVRGVKKGAKLVDDIIDAALDSADAVGIRNVYKGLKHAPQYPSGFRGATGQIFKDKVNNRKLLPQLRDIEPGKWQKVYKNGYDATGNKVSIHYHESKSGKVFNVKVVNNWYKPNR